MKNTRILIIEDEQDIRSSLQEVLESEGYTIFQASNGREGLELLRSIEPPHLILLDLMMPVMDGEDFLTSFQNISAYARIPVIMLSATRKPQSPIPVKTMRKPIDLDELIQLVAQNIAD